MPHQQKITWGNVVRFFFAFRLCQFFLMLDKQVLPESCCICPWLTLDVPVSKNFIEVRIVPKNQIKLIHFELNIPILELYLYFGIMRRNICSIKIKILSIFNLYLQPLIVFYVVFFLLFFISNFKSTVGADWKRANTRDQTIIMFPGITSESLL